MEVREMKAFVAIAEELNFRKAAERLGVSQPPLTRLIGKLEDDLKVILFTRTTRKVELTGAGVFLLSRCRQILQSIHEAEVEIKKLADTKRGELVISLTPSSIHSNLPKLISSFRQQFSSIKVSMVETPNSMLEKKLGSGEVDIAFSVNTPTDANIKSVPVFSQELGLLISINNPLSKRKSIRFFDLQNETLIFHGKHDHLGFQDEFHRFLKSKNVNVQVYYKKPKESCRNLAVLDKGLLISTKNFLFADTATVFVPFSEYYPKLKTQGWWLGNNRSLALKAFVSFIEENSLVPQTEMDYHLG